ncbi:MAG: hypothetical protein ACE5GJ_02280 [Gemmatimonadota bacterium]
MIATFFIALFTGLAVGLHSATWGMFKDAPHEGFTWQTYLRSPVIASFIAVLVAFGFGLDVRSAAGLAVLFGATYGLERAVLEIYKTFLREEDQSKYAIPMQLAVFGRPVRSRGARLLVGVGYLTLGLLVLAGAYWLQDHPDVMPRYLAVGLVGSAGGWISAFGGAWKDAPVEGFSIFKFFRSPFITLCYGLFMAALTPDYGLIFLGAIGYTVATIETYKTFFFPNEYRGKFTGKPRTHPEYVESRYHFVPLYVLIWLGMITAGIAALTGPRHGALFGDEAAVPAVETARNPRPAPGV